MLREIFTHPWCIAFLSSEQVNLQNIIDYYPTVTRGKRTLAGDIKSELSGAYKEGFYCLMGNPPH